MQNHNYKLQTVGEIAKLLSVSTFGMYRMIKAGKIPHYAFGRKILLDHAEVRDALRVSAGDH